ncbi:hypothetical protein Tco_0636124, partial [Tanacetum coccineum]
DENIEKFEVASKSKSFTSKPQKVTAHKVVTQKVQTKPFLAKSPIPIRNCIIGLAAGHTWACIGNITFGTRKPKDAIVADQDRKGKKKGRNFLQSCGGSIGSYDPMLEQIDIPGILHLQGRLFESRGCLLLVCRDDIGSREFTIYEMMKGCSVWTVSNVELRMAFDPRKSLYYKVVQEGRTSEGLNMQLKHYKFNFEDHDHPILTTIEIPHGLHRGRNFLESFGGYSDDPILMLMEIPQMLHLEGTFFESRGCLLLVCRDNIGSREFTIYEMMQGCSVWSVRYLVNIEDFMNPLPEGWSIRSTVWSIGLGEKEEDSFLVINLSEKVVKCNLISKTINEIFDIGSNQMDDDDDVEFIPPFSVDPNLYEFISSLPSV